jgi:transcriptional regulator with XRE-family HTH domain
MGDNFRMFDGGLVKRLLDEQGRTRKWFARECGIETKSLTHLLNGHVQPGRPLLKLIAIKLGVNEQSLDPELNSEFHTTAITPHREAAV